jgi:hypothetical protein
MWPTHLATALTPSRVDDILMPLSCRAILPMTLAIADLMPGLIPLTPRQRSHGRRCYADFEVMRSLCADAAEKWRGTFLGGWASICLAAVLRLQLKRMDEMIAVLEHRAADYAATPFSEYALEDLAATVTFSLGDLAIVCGHANCLSSCYRGRR